MLLALATWKKAMYELCCTSRRASHETTDAHVKFAPSEVVEFREDKLEGSLKRKSVKCVTSTVVSLNMNDPELNSGQPNPQHGPAWRVPQILVWWRSNAQRSQE